MMNVVYDGGNLHYEPNMNRQEFRDWVLENFNVGNNFTLAPAMLDGILEYAIRLDEGDERNDFLCLTLPSIPEEVIQSLDLGCAC